MQWSDGENAGFTRAQAAWLTPAADYHTTNVQVYGLTQYFVAVYSSVAVNSVMITRMMMMMMMMMTTDAAAAVARRRTDAH
jgi:hypothetical protein